MLFSILSSLVFNLFHLIFSFETVHSPFSFPRFTLQARVPFFTLLVPVLFFCFATHFPTLFSATGP